MRDTIDMAREAGFELGKVFVNGVLIEDTTSELKAFEALVRADEREACAKLCKFDRTSADIEISIRARGETK